MSYAEALRFVTSGDTVPHEDLRRWIESGDLLTWSAVYVLLERPSTPFPSEDAADFMRRYLLRCIEENPSPGDYVHGGYEAAWELAALLKEWRRRGGRMAASIRGIAVELERLYRRGEPATSNRVLCGVLEHAFEDAALRPYFANWDRDPELREAYKLAVEWGAAHEE
jgi:hypothetical protein